MYVIDGDFCNLLPLLVRLKLERYLLNSTLHAIPFWYLSEMLRLHSDILELASCDLFVIKRHAVSGYIFCKLGVSDAQFGCAACVYLNQSMACIDLSLDVILHCKKFNLPLSAPNLGVMAVKSVHGVSYLTFFYMSNRRKENLEEFS